jgi:hypothetical protein
VDKYMLDPGQDSGRLAARAMTKGVDAGAEDQLSSLHMQSVYLPLRSLGTSPTKVYSSEVDGELLRIATMGLLAKEDLVSEKSAFGPVCSAGL